MNTKKLRQTLKAFTLAEVLITLGIIGIIAAMTIPTLLQNKEKTGNGHKTKKSLHESFPSGEIV